MDPKVMEIIKKLVSHPFMFEISSRAHKDDPSAREFYDLMQSVLLQLSVRTFYYLKPPPETNRKEH